MIDNGWNIMLEVIGEREEGHFPARIPRRSRHNNVVEGYVSKPLATELAEAGLIEIAEDQTVRLTAAGRDRVAERRTR